MASWREWRHRGEEGSSPTEEGRGESVCRWRSTRSRFEMADYGFKKADRISSSAEIREILRSGERFRVGPIQILRGRQKTRGSRVAIAVKGSAGSSPERNRVKRQLRELFRKNREIFGPYDYFFYIVSPQGSLKNLNWAETQRKILDKL